MGEDRVRERGLFSGVVQGVGFRATCVGVAGELGVVGWVRNLDDGRVEAEIEGPAEAVERFYELVAARTFGRVERADRALMGCLVGERGFEIV